MKLKPEFKCNHRKTIIIQFHRKNYPFGRKSEKRNYSVRMCKKICEICGKEVLRYKPR